MDTKPGWKTSEFWINLGGLAALVIGPEKGEHVNTLITALCATYTGGRTLIKTFKK